MLRMPYALTIATLLFLTAAPSLRAAEPDADQEGFTALFNGRDLAGWTKRGGDATYEVEEGAIVGRSTVPATPNTWVPVPYFNRTLSLPQRRPASSIVQEYVASPAGSIA